MEEIVSINDWYFCTDIRDEKERKKIRRHTMKNEAFDKWAHADHEMRKTLSPCQRGKAFTIMRCVSLKMSSENLHGAKGFSHIYRPTVPSVRVSHNGIKRHTHGGITLTEHSFQVALLWHARRLEVKSKMHNGSPKFVGGIWTGVHTTGRWNLTAKV